MHLTTVNICSKNNCAYAGESDKTCSRCIIDSLAFFHGLALYDLFVTYSEEPIWNITAHARLMFRNEVTRLDAITAILCIESSMTTSAIVDSMGNALHSNFAENPDQECILMVSSYSHAHES